MGNKIKFRLFRTPQHREFQYRPMYWNPEKEKSEAFKKRISKIRKNDVEGTKARISSGLRTGYGGNTKLKADLRLRSNIRILAIVSFLVLICFYLINRYLDVFIAWLAGEL